MPQPLLITMYFRQTCYLYIFNPQSKLFYLHNKTRIFHTDKTSEPHQCTLCAMGLTLGDIKLVFSFFFQSFRNSSLKFRMFSKVFPTSLSTFEWNMSSYLMLIFKFSKITLHFRLCLCVSKPLLHRGHKRVKEKHAWLICTVLFSKDV